MRGAGGMGLTAARLDGFGDAGQTVLRPGHAVVRWVACDVAPDFWLAALDAAERERAGRFHFAEDRASFIAAHALGRGMLAQFGGIAAADWRFVTGRFGKPAVDPALGCSWLHFNLSHTRGMAACVVMRDVEVGVDVEALDRRRDVQGIADRFFVAEEVRLIELAEEKHAAFLRLWTMKESVMKATGQGFDLALNAFAVTLDPPGVWFQEGERGGWSFHQQGVGPRHVVAVAARAAEVRFEMGMA